MRNELLRWAEEECAPEVVDEFDKGYVSALKNLIDKINSIPVPSVEEEWVSIGEERVTIRHNTNPPPADVEGYLEGLPTFEDGDAWGSSDRYLYVSHALTALRALKEDCEGEIELLKQGKSHYFKMMNEALHKVEELTAEVERLSELKELYKGYARLLADELDEVVPMANVHQWKSTRFEKGKEFRDKIAELDLPNPPKQ